MSPRAKGRLAGLSEMLEGVTATYGQVIVLGHLVVAGNAAASAANVLAHERLYWLGLASCLAGVMFHVAWAAVFYDLFKVVNRSLTRFATFVILVGCAIQAVAAVLYLAPWLVLHGQDRSPPLRRSSVRGWRGGFSAGTITRSTCISRSSGFGAYS